MIWLLQTYKGIGKEDTKLFFCNFGRLEKIYLLVLADHEEVFLNREGDT